MAQERLEVRFSPSNAEENEIIKALDALTEYGAKGRFLKARLLRGLVCMTREIESIKAESDPLAALDRVAQSMDSGTYYALRAMLYPPTAAAAAPSAVQAPVMPKAAPAERSGDLQAVHAAPAAPEAAQGALQASGAEQVSDAVVAAPEPVSMAPEVVAPVELSDVQVPVRDETATVDVPPAVEPANEAVEASPVDSVVAEAAPAPVPTPEAANVVAEEAVAVESPAPAAKPFSWDRFAGIAGTRGGG